jgi:cytochrome c peroxidase
MDAKTVSGRRRLAHWKALSSTAVTERFMHISLCSTIAPTMKPCSARCPISRASRAKLAPLTTQRRAAWDTLPLEDRQVINQIYSNMGKAIAAYERNLAPGPSRFDAYIEAAVQNDRQKMQTLLTKDEVAGLRLFIGKANCTQCHNGPLLTDNHFHNTGVPAVATLPEDKGRAQGAPQVRGDEFNCLSRYSDAKPEDCAELRYMVADGHDLIRQFKPPSLRNVDGRGPFMHAGQFATLNDVVTHYNRAPEAPAGHSEIHPLNLSDMEIQQLIAFLKTLNGVGSKDLIRSAHDTTRLGSGRK